MSCTRPKVGMDSYGLTPLGLEPLQVLRWAGEHGAQGVQFSGVEEEQQSLLDEVYLKEMRQYAADERMYLEWGGAQHIPRRMESWEAKDVFQVNRRAAEQARALGCRIIRSCSGGLMRWRDDSPLTDALIAESAGALTEQKSMLRDHGVVLAIETHFEFTTHELLRLLSMCEAEP